MTGLGFCGLLRVRHCRFETSAVGGTYVDGDTLAHAPDSHDPREPGNPEQAMNAGVTRRSLIGLIGCALPLTAFAQQSAPARVKRIGLLTGNEAPLIVAFKDELGRLGYLEGETLIIETSRPNTADLTSRAAELAHMDLELIVAASLRPAEEVRRANPAMPMVIATCPGMVSNGFAQSLEHPGGIVTGMDELPPALPQSV
jgi:hypothetical protein